MGKPSPIYVDKDIRTKVPTIKRTAPFPWYGGKTIHLKWLLPLLPESRVYCEPFGGSAAVLLARDPSPIDVYNDIDGGVVHFFRMLRDRGDELIKAISLTPYSREEFFYSLVDRNNPDDIERARLFFVRARSAYAGKAQTATLGRWSHSVTVSSRGMAKCVASYLSSVEKLPEIVQRLRSVLIENRPAIDVIRLYDSSDTLFYCDPPYPHQARVEDRAYSVEMTDEDHRKLAEVLHQCKGRVAVSGYRCPLMDELYGDWVRHDQKPKGIPSTGALRQESLWTNYDRP